MLGTFTTVLGLLGTVAPLFTKSEQVAEGIKLVTDLMPVAIVAGGEMWDQVKVGIAALRQSGAATPEQLAELDRVEAIGDAAFDAALKAAEAADAAALERKTT